MKDIASSWTNCYRRQRLNNQLCCSWTYHVDPADAWDYWLLEMHVTFSIWLERWFLIYCLIHPSWYYSSFAKHFDCFNFGWKIGWSSSFVVGDLCCWAFSSDWLSWRGVLGCWQQNHLSFLFCGFLHHSQRYQRNFHRLYLMNSSYDGSCFRIVGHEVLAH